MMKPNAYLINIARGNIVDEKALIRALVEKRIEGAALDVFEQEPTAPDNPLLKLDNVVFTPHQAGMSPRAKKLLDKMIFEELLRLAKGEKPRWPVKELRA